MDLLGVATPALNRAKATAKRPPHLVTAGSLEGMQQSFGPEAVGLAERVCRAAAGLGNMRYGSTQFRRGHSLHAQELL